MAARRRRQAAVGTLTAAQVAGSRSARALTAPGMAAALLRPHSHSGPAAVFFLPYDWPSLMCPHRSGNPAAQAWETSPPESPRR